MLEPCLWLKRDKFGALSGLVLIEVDDLIVTGRSPFLEAFQKAATSRFKFGKWKERESDYSGRHIMQYPDRITVDQEKYIREQLTVLPIDKNRRSDPESPLTASEIK
eukprot:8013529-Pyramimonas_sp.AAC.1